MVHFESSRARVRIRKRCGECGARLGRGRVEHESASAIWFILGMVLLPALIGIVFIAYYFWQRRDRVVQECEECGWASTRTAGAF